MKPGKMLRLLEILALFSGAVYSCQPPDCEFPDCGTCGNACCSLEFRFGVDVNTINETISKSLKDGGADKRYRYNGYSDMRKYKIPNGAKFLIQGQHETLKMHYNDTLNFLLLANTTNFTEVKAFSISQIYGAYCDDGQNYKNIVGFVKGLSLDFEQKTVFGCTNK